jgi:hypothetical protein
MQITFRLPSKAVSYGYVEVTGDHREFGLDDDDVTAKNLGISYATFIAAYWGSEIAATENIAKGRHDLIKSELGGKVVSETANPERTQVSDIEEAINAGAAVDMKPWEQKAEAQSKPWEKVEQGVAAVASDMLAAKPLKATPKVASIEF